MPTPEDAEPTVATLLAAARRRLAAAGVPDAALEARILLEAASGLPRTRLFAEPDLRIPEDAVRRFRDMVERRAAREPLAYILGRREFFGLEFEVGPEVLVPRPETELVVERALAHIGDPGRPLRFVDIGTGSGCLLVTLLVHMPAAFGVGTDLSFPALPPARRNARRHGVADRAGFVCCHWAEALSGPFDLVVSNPPYVASHEMRILPPEVRHEPHHALEAGREGLDAYRAILADLPRILARHGLAVLEVGRGQSGAVLGIARSHGLAAVEVRPDLAGIPRVVVLRRESS
ncbi:Release factor glutamine methyltransferase [bacterium HR39]|nr:Release factor glutamine methyltransferase [bacterium HR39]